MNEIHRKVCDDADKQQKQAKELVEAHLGRNQDTHRLQGGTKGGDTWDMHHSRHGT